MGAPHITVFLGAPRSWIWGLEGKQEQQRACTHQHRPVFSFPGTLGMNHLEPQSPQMSLLLLSSHHGECFPREGNWGLTIVLASLKCHQTGSKLRRKDYPAPPLAGPVCLWSSSGSSKASFTAVFLQGASWSSVATWPRWWEG